MPREFTVIVEQDEEEYYVATVPQLHGCHTQASSLDELMVRVKEAIQLCLEVEAEEDLAPLQLVGVQRVIV
jgi:predicted RNase H-like HicB family nuclease